jgi:hypothetical protein
MEDSRIPVWMINAETTNADGSEFQVIVSQPKENVFAGLNRHVDTKVRVNAADYADQTLNGGTDTGHAFMMKGPDTITGVKNGFLNIAPDLGGVAGRFAGAFGGISTLSTVNMHGFTVGGFEGMSMDVMSTSMAGSGAAMVLLLDGVDVANLAGDWTDLPAGFTTTIGNVGNDEGDTLGSVLLQLGFGSMYDTNLADDKTDGVDDTAFDYMANTTFQTFDAFVGAGSQYVYNMPTDGEVDLAARFKNSTKEGVNYSMNASYNYDKNPIINMSWKNAAGGKVYVNKVYNNGTNAQVLNTTTSGYSLILSDSILADGTTVTNGAYGGAAKQYATLVFEQEVKRVLNLGGSFDMAIETAALGPVVIRGEALYTKGGYSPIIDKTKLSYGDLVGALEMVKGNRLKYVLGADITALTNMMISFQYIEDRNLDFIDGTNRYTADYATMSMANGFNKAIETKNFYSLFFSKPFGASGEHRWNNITMLEESANGNGKWNRLDAEFSIDDDTQATVEWNRYWGDTNSQFGQLDKSSNIQVGVKYSF